MLQPLLSFRLHNVLTPTVECARVYFCCLLIAFFTPTCTAKDPLIIQTDKGDVQGFTMMTPHGKQVDAFFGIPFAQPPLGHLRFRPPIPREPWQDVFNATKESNSCYQPFDTAFGDFHGSTMWNANSPLSEDCLYLNIWLPRPRPASAAVMVWIYGGGFYSGTITLDIYDGSILAAEEDIIVVSFQYRIGSLGFLYTGSPDAPGNAGMFDQQLALQWIQANIGVFGGNPRNVTLFGESAGAASVALHLLAPMSRHLFAQAIMQSGAATCPWATVGKAVARQRAADMATKADCYRGSRGQPEWTAIVECLRALPADVIVDKEWVTSGLLEFPFVPVIDGVFLPKSPEAILKSGQFKRANILMGSNENEGSFFIVYHYEQFLALTDSVHLSHEELITSLERAFHNLSRVAKDAIIFQYTDWLRPHNPAGNVELLEKAVGDYGFTCNVNEMAWAYAGAGQNVHMYRFTHRSSSVAWPKWMGVIHGDEIDYVFGLPLVNKRNYGKEEKELSRRVMNYWANFAKTGNPSFKKDGGFAQHSWPIYTLHGKEYLSLGSKEPVVGRGPRATQCAFWKKYLPQLLSMTADIDDAEIEWKKQFQEWNANYIVDWKAQFDSYVRHAKHLEHSGTITLDIYDGAILASEENVIVVSLQYRVGSLGFLYFGTDEVPGNAGMHDQVMALRWVRQNIANFGGNAQNITLFGESAGAASVNLHLLSPLSRDLFKQAIMQSGSATCPWAVITPQVALNRSLVVTEKMGCLQHGNKMMSDNHLEEVVKCLRRVEAQKFVDHEWVTDGLLEFPFVPVIDGEFLPQKPETILRSGQFKRANVLMGSNKDEGTFWINYYFEQLLTLKEDVHLTQEELTNAIERAFSNFSRVAKDAIIFQYTNWLHPNDPVGNVDLLEKAVGDYGFTCNVNEMAWTYTSAGQNVYMYFFDHRTSSQSWPKWMGAVHGYEIDYVFGLPFDPKRPYTDEERALSKRFMHYYANFAKTGSPSLTKDGGYVKHSWPVYTLHGKEYLTLNTKDPVIGRGPRATQCAFWKKYMPQLTSMTADIDEMEAQWKQQFNEWNTRYIVDWKAQFDRYMRHTSKLPSRNPFLVHEDL